MKVDSTVQPGSGELGRAVGGAGGGLRAGVDDEVAAGTRGGGRGEEQGGGERGQRDASVHLRPSHSGRCVSLAACRQTRRGSPAPSRVNSLKTFRIVALMEATSFLALLVASVLKRTADAEIGVTILGPLHGLLFIAYVLIALALRPDQGWSTRRRC